jgi:protein-disulfide isomerase
MEPQENDQKSTSNTPEHAPVVEHTTTVKTSKPSIGIGAAIITAGAMIAVALIIALHSSGSAAITPTTAPTTPQATVAVDASKVNTVNEPYIGNANAPVTIAYWFDYQCPFCKQNELQTMPEIVTNYVDTGKVKIVFKDFAFLGPDSQTLGQYGRAVWAEDPAKFEAWHDTVFADQGTENTGWATQSEINSIDTKVLGASEAATVTQLVKTNGATYQKEMDADKAEAGTFGIQGTPAFIIGKQLITGAQPYAQFQAAIETALSGK